MLDLKFIRENPDAVKKALQNRSNKDLVPKIDELLKLDKEHRQLLTETESLKAEQNRISKEIGRQKKEGKSSEEKSKGVDAGWVEPGTMKKMKVIAQKVAEIDKKVGGLSTRIAVICWQIPNIPSSDAPIGQDPSENTIVRDWDKAKKFDFKPKPHWEIGEKLGILDLPRGTKVTGSHFPVFKGAGALLERALINFMLDFHIDNHGYKEIAPPFLVNEKSMTGTGQLPKLKEDMYRTKEDVESDELYLIPTGEVPVTNLHRDEILNEEDLPINYVAYTPCFRREAGSYGKDTRGITRVHQFDKVEMVKFTTPETSYAEHEKLLKNAEAILQALGLHYRVVLLCTGDLSFAGAKCYDLEVWAPGTNSFLEVSSCSIFESFQARRANIRYRKKENKKVDFVHTLNASGLALPRTVIALLENYQQEDGNVLVPEILHPYMRGLTKIG